MISSEQFLFNGLTIELKLPGKAKIPSHLFMAIY
jgi:hypothetical protein